MTTQTKVALSKEKHPEYYCPAPRCLWRVMASDPVTGQMRLKGDCLTGYCPRHRKDKP